MDKWYLEATQKLFKNINVDNFNYPDISRMLNIRIILSVFEITEIYRIRA